MNSDGSRSRAGRPRPAHRAERLYCVLYLLLQHKKLMTRARPTHSRHSTEYCRIHNEKGACLLKGQHATIRLIIITPENSGVIFNRKIYEIPRAGSAGFMRWFSTVQVDSTRIDIIVLVPGIYSCRSRSRSKFRSTAVYTHGCVCTHTQ